MKLSEILSKDNLVLNLKSKKKDDVLKEMVAFLSKNNEIDENEVLKGIMVREEVMSTGLGQGVAIPHTKAESTKDIVVLFGRLKDGIDFKSIDGEPVYLIFMVVVPQDATVSQIKILARISRLLKHNYIREKLKVLKTKEEIINFISQEEERHLPH
ncbi:MAG: PTS sugar transporter subunit IIA [bacterium]